MRCIRIFLVVLATNIVTHADETVGNPEVLGEPGGLDLLRGILTYNDDSYEPWSKWGKCMPKDCKEFRYRRCKDDSYKHQIFNLITTTKCPFEYIAETRPCKSKSLCRATEGSASAITRLRDVCGIKPNRPMTRITGGGAAKPHTWPWQVPIFAYRYAKANMIPFCGSTLISDKWLLTAAHCLTNIAKEVNLPKNVPFDIAKYTGINIMARMGEHDTSRDDQGHEINVKVASCIIHPEHKSSPLNVRYDIALLRLAKPVPVKNGSHINVACLPDPDLEIPAGQKCFAAGWGRMPRREPERKPEIGGILDQIFGQGGSWADFGRSYKSGETQAVLREVELPIKDLSSCSGFYGGLQKNVHVCAGMRGKDTCEGDSGGGLHCVKDGRHYVYGVTSYGTSEGCGTSYSIYAHVPGMSKWIHEHVR